MRYAAWSTPGARGRPPRERDVDGETRGAVAGSEGLEASETEWRLDVPPSCRQLLVAEGSDELVDLAERLARDLFDRLERRLRALRVPGAEQPGRPCMDEDDVDGVSGGVVEVACDARPLFCGRETALALGFPFRPIARSSSRSDPFAPHADAVSDHPRPAPDETPNRSGTVGKSVLRDADCTGVDQEQSGDDDAGNPLRSPCLLGAQGEEVESDGRAERGTGG